MPLRENIKTAFRECNELRGDAARLEREIAILRGALERIAQVLPGGNTLRERTCWEITQDALQDASRITCPVCENEALRKRMEMLQKSLAYYRCGLIGERPFYIPSRVRLPQMVCGEGPYQVVRAEAGDHDCTSNQYGAISVMANNGKQLGVKPSEFEPLEWVRNPKA